MAKGFVQSWLSAVTHLRHEQDLLPSLLLVPGNLLATKQSSTCPVRKKIFLTEENCVIKPNLFSSAFSGLAWQSRECSGKPEISQGFSIRAVLGCQSCPCSCPWSSWGIKQFLSHPGFEKQQSLCKAHHFPSVPQWKWSGPEISARLVFGVCPSGLQASYCEVRHPKFIALALLHDNTLGVTLQPCFSVEENLEEAAVIWKLPTGVLQGGEGKLRFGREQKKKNYESKHEPRHKVSFCSHVLALEQTIVLDSEIGS